MIVLLVCLDYALSGTVLPLLEPLVVF